MSGVSNQRTPADFWIRTKLAGNCLEWQGRLDKDGYGRLRYHGGRYGAHQVAWLLIHGKKADLCVCHSCNNKKCVSPQHLYEATNEDNTRHAARDGIHGGANLKGKTNLALKDKVNWARVKLPLLQREAIRADTRHITLIAADYDVSTTTIRNIQQRRGVINTVTLGVSL